MPLSEQHSAHTIRGVIKCYIKEKNGKGEEVSFVPKHLFGI